MKIGQNPDIPAPAAPSAARSGAGASTNALSSAGGNIGNRAVGAAAATAAGAAGSTQVRAGAPAANAAGVAVTVSQSARAFQVTAGSSTFDARKVAEVRAAIDNGTYRVDADAIADKLLSNAQQVLRNARA